MKGKVSDVSCCHLVPYSGTPSEEEVLESQRIAEEWKVNQRGTSDTRKFQGKKRNNKRVSAPSTSATSEKKSKRIIKNETPITRSKTTPKSASNSKNIVRESRESSVESELSPPGTPPIPSQLFNRTDILSKLKDEQIEQKDQVIKLKDQIIELKDDKIIDLDNTIKMLKEQIEILKSNKKN